MKIAYLIDYDLNTNSGVIQKIKQNASQWIEKGHIVYYVSLKTMSIYNSEQKIIFQEKSIDIKFGRIGTAIELLYNSYFANKILEKIEFDLIYMRYRLYMPFVNKLFKQYKTVMEINGDDTVEYKLKSQLTHYYNKFTRNMLLKHIDAFVLVSHELKERFEYLSRPMKVIANGIDIREYSFEKTDTKMATLVFIATPDQPWQGLDKILNMAKYFVNYQFYIIGTQGDDIDNVKYFGYLSKEESSNIIQKCDIGIGTLSLYKQGLNEASPLKTRQYLACGLPVIFAYEDTDLSEDLDFALRLDNKENNLDFQKIENFVQSVFGNNTIRVQAREFAESELDYGKKEEDRLSFFRSLLNE